MSDYAGPILGVVGAVIGGFAGAGAFSAVGAQWGWAIGSAIGGMYSASQQVIPGPKIGEVQKQSSQEGGFRPIVYGRSQPIFGNVLADGGPVIVTRSERQGKGGPKVESESAFRTYAVGFCEGEATLLQAWRNGILVYDVEDPGMASDNAKFLEYATWYTGSFDQNASPDLEAIYGAGNAPYFRGTAYLSLHEEDTTDQRGAWSQWQVRVFRGAAKSYTSVPYPVQAVDSVTYQVAPTGGQLRTLLHETSPVDDVTFAIAPTGGRLREPLVTAHAEDDLVTFGITPSGGTLRTPLVTADADDTEVTYGIAPTGGTLRAALLVGDTQDSEVTYGIVPTGGRLQ